MLLSILIPTYNVAGYVADCLASVLAQVDWATMEVLICDDASTDDTVAVVERVRAQHPAVQLLRQPVNAGPGATRNALLRQAQGRYVAFIDADDTVCSGALGRVCAVLVNEQPDLLLVDYRIVSEQQDGTVTTTEHVTTFRGPSGCKITDPSAIVSGLMQARRLHPWSKIARRTLYRDGALFPEHHVFEDVTMSVRLALAARSAVYMADPCIAYRKHPASLLGRMDARKKLGLMASLDYPDLKARWASLDEAAQFHWAHFIARNLIECVAYHRAHHLDPEFLATCFERYLRSTPLSPRALSWSYVRRGWWWRLARYLARLAQVQRTLAQRPVQPKAASADNTQSVALHEPSRCAPSSPSVPSTSCTSVTSASSNAPVRSVTGSSSESPPTR